MSPIAIALDLLLAALMLVALGVGGRLNRRLTALRNSQASFANSVAELNEAAGRAEAGLASLRAASEEAHDALLTRIETARALIVKLDTALVRAEQASPAVSPMRAQAEPRADGSTDPKPSSGGTRTVPADPVAARTADVPPPPAFAPTPQAVRPQRRPTIDDELFEGEGPPMTSAPQPAPASAARTWDGPLKGDRR